jgi:galactokinase
MRDAKNLFRNHFGQTPTHVVLAPGRLELLGNHTDYNNGLVMALAVDRYIEIASSPRTDGKVELVSDAFPGHEIFAVNELTKNPKAPWADYVKGVLEQLHKRGVHSRGFSAAIAGDIPIGAGMSSSAALEVATALTVRRLYPFSLKASSLGTPPERDRQGELPALGRAEKLSFARLCQAAENEFVGVRSGLLDQISSLFGKAARKLRIGGAQAGRKFAARRRIKGPRGQQRQTNPAGI